MNPAVVERGMEGEKQVNKSSRSSLSEQLGSGDVRHASRAIRLGRVVSGRGAMQQPLGAE